MNEPRLPKLARALLWTDGLAGASVGVGVLVLHPWLARLYGLAESLVLALGVANLLYGAYSSRLALRMARGKRPSARSVDLLVAANGAWAIVCFALAVVFLGKATLVGVGVLVFEGLFVGGLALLERRYLRPHLG